MNWTKLYRIERRIIKKNPAIIKSIIIMFFLLLLSYSVLQIFIFISTPNDFKPEPWEIMQISDPKISFKYSSSPSYIKKVELNGKDVTKNILFTNKEVYFTPGNLSEGNHEVNIFYHHFLSIWPIKKSWQFSIDTALPYIYINSPSKKDFYTDNKSLTMTGKTEIGAILKIIRNNKLLETKVDSKGEFVLNYILNEGQNNFKLISTDKAGNEAEYNLTVFLDLIPPKLSSPFPPPDNIVKEVDPLISATVIENGEISRFSMKINGKPVPAELKSTIITCKPERLAEGTHNILVEVEDKVGFKHSLKWSFTIDSTEDFGRRIQIFGAIGEDVKDLQKRLTYHGYLEDKNITGIFDQKTLDSVMKFQKDKGFASDGIVGPATVEALSYSIVIDLAEFSLSLIYDGNVIKHYWIACGSPEYPTPTGEFIITNKIKDPTWIPPDSPWAKEAELTEPGPDNPLGTRWLELNSSQVGIHGTNYPDTIGLNVSHGCIRMTIPSVEELYEYVNIGTRVTIKNPILPPPTPVPTPVPQTPTPTIKIQETTKPVIYIEN